jgi:hypothetical protein
MLLLSAAAPLTEAQHEHMDSDAYLAYPCVYIRVRVYVCVQEAEPLWRLLSCLLAFPFPLALRLVQLKKEPSEFVRAVRAGNRSTQTQRALGETGASRRGSRRSCAPCARHGIGSLLSDWYSGLAVG